MRSRSLVVKTWVAIAAGTWLLALVAPPVAADALGDDAPSNEELYQMLLELKAEQQRLVGEAAAARADAARAQAQLEATQQQLETARQELESRSHAPIAATPAVSAAPASEEKGFVREADLARGASLFAEANIVRFTDGELGYATLTTESNSVFGSGSNRIVDPKYQAGWTVGGTYALGGPVDFSFSYNDHHQTGDAELTPPYKVSNDNVFVGLNASLAPADFGRDAVSARATVDVDYWSVNADVGENLEVGDHLALRLFGGVRYSDIGEHFRAYYFGGDFPDDIDEPLRCDADDCGISGVDYSYWGAGPRVGARGRYHLPWGLSLFGQAAGSLLVGKQEAEAQFSTNGDEDPVASVYRDFGVRMVPVVEVRAGMGWQHALGSWGSFFVDAGYEFQNFFDVVKRFTFDGDTASGVFSTNTSDLAIDGPYVRGGFSFNGP